MRCKYCGYDVDLEALAGNSPSTCSTCQGIEKGLRMRTITSAAVKRILDATRPEEAWKATWGKAAPRW